MRDPARIPEVLALIERLWVKVPDWRLGQIVFNATGAYDCFHAEDDALVDGLKALIARYGA